MVVDTRPLGEEVSTHARIETAAWPRLLSNSGLARFHHRLTSHVVLRRRSGPLSWARGPPARDEPRIFACRCGACRCGREVRAPRTPPQETLARSRPLKESRSVRHRKFFRQIRKNARNVARFRDYPPTSAHYDRRCGVVSSPSAIGSVLRRTFLGDRIGRRRPSIGRAGDGVLAVGEPRLRQG